MGEEELKDEWLSAKSSSGLDSGVSLSEGTAWLGGVAGGDLASGLRARISCKTTTGIFPLNRMPPASLQPSRSFSDHVLRPPVSSGQFWGEPLCVSPLLSAPPESAPPASVLHGTSERASSGLARSSFCLAFGSPLSSPALAIPLRGLEGVPGLPGAPQDEAGLTRKLETSHVGGATCPRDEGCCGVGGASQDSAGFGATEDPLKEGMTTHSSILACRIPTDTGIAEGAG